MDNTRDTVSQSLKILQITDSHLGGSADETLLGLNTEQSLRDVLQDVQSKYDEFDYIVMTGDISNDGSVESYERYVAIVRDYFPSTPLAWLDGNHDDPAKMASVRCERPVEQYFAIENWNVICLSSRIPFEEGGALSEAELQRLDLLLAQKPSSPTLVFLHHQAVPVGSHWVDNYVVNNAEDFFKVIDKYSHVKAVAWGHVHQEFSSMRKNVALLASPSTCVQFKQNSHEFAVDKKMPGYRVFTLYPDGSFDSIVERISDRDYPIDYVSTGY